MATLTFRSRVPADGVLELRLPDEAGEEVEVTVETRPMTKAAHAFETDEEWHEFVRRTAGSMPWLERPPQPPLEERNPLD